MRSPEIFVKSKALQKDCVSTKSMGNLKTFVLTCLGVGLAVGAGFYLYRKFTSANEDDRNTENTATQVTAKI